MYLRRFLAAKTNTDATNWLVGICERSAPCAQDEDAAERCNALTPRSSSELSKRWSVAGGPRVVNGPGVVQSPMGFIDGDHTPDSWVNAPSVREMPTCADNRYVTIDLGKAYMTTGATLWHWYGDTRSYCNQKVAVSVTGTFDGEEMVMYETGSCTGYCTFPANCNNAEAGDCTPDNYGPPETQQGHRLSWNPTRARYVRHWSSRNDVNGAVDFVEMDIHGYDIDTPAETVEQEVVHTASGTQMCRGLHWHTVNGVGVHAPQLRNGEWDAAACRTMLAEDPFCSTEWFTVASNNGHCGCVPAGSEQAPAGNCNCGSVLQVIFSGASSVAECRAQCAANENCVSFGLWTGANRGACGLFDQACPTDPNAPCPSPTNVADGYTNDVFNMLDAGRASSTECVLQSYENVFGTFHVTTASVPGLVDVPEALRTYENTWQNVPPGGELARSSLESVAAWCAVGATVPGWLQMDLGSSIYVAQIVTRGRADANFNQWVTQYKVQHSTDAITFMEVPALFTGNSDENTKVYATLPEPVLARYVRLVPTAWSVHACMRAAVIVAPPCPAPEPEPEPEPENVMEPVPIPPIECQPTLVPYSDRYTGDLACTGTEGDVCEYICSLGYEDMGDGFIICLPDGQFSDTIGCESNTAETGSTVSTTATVAVTSTIAVTTAASVSTSVGTSAAASAGASAGGAGVSAGVSSGAGGAAGGAGG